MKSNFLKQSLAFVLALSYVGQITAGVAAKPTQAVASFSEFSQKWNNISSSWPKNHSEHQIKNYLKTLGMKYNPRFEKEDSAFLKLHLAQLNEFPKIAKTDKGVVLSVKSDYKIEIVNVGEAGFVINGKAFKPTPEMTLEQTRSLLSDLLIEKQKTSFLDSLFMPSAQANFITEHPFWTALIAGVAIWMGINWYNNRQVVSEGFHEAHQGHKKILQGVTDTVPAE